MGRERCAGAMTSTDRMQNIAAELQTDKRICCDIDSKSMAEMQER
jgi:hypothetical protein